VHNAQAPTAMPERARHRSWPKRLPHSLRVPQNSLWFNLEVNARRYPDKPALVFFDRSLSYRKLHAQAEHVAAHLQAHGVQAGDRAMLLMQNSPQWVVACYAIARVNAVLVPVNPMNRAEELKHTITDPDVKVAICAADLAGELLKASSELPPEQRLTHLLVSHYRDAFGPDAELPEAWKPWFDAQHPMPTLPDGSVIDWREALACTEALGPHDRGPGDLSVLPYTSGTTGMAKGCMHTHASILHNAVASAV